MDYKKSIEETASPKNRAQEDISRNKHKKELKKNLRKYSDFCDDDSVQDFESFERIKKRF